MVIRPRSPQERRREKLLRQADAVNLRSSALMASFPEGDRMSDRARMVEIAQLSVDALDCTDPIIYEKDWGSESPSDSLKTLHRILAKIRALAGGPCPAGCMYGIDGVGEPCSSCTPAAGAAASTDLDALRDWARRARSLAYECEADLAEAEGDLEGAAWKRALAREDYDEAHRYWIRRQARKNIAFEPYDRTLTLEEWTEVLAEAERMRVEAGRGT